MRLGAARGYAGLVNTDTNAPTTETDAEVVALRALASLKEPRNRFELDDALDGVAELARQVTSANYAAVTIIDSHNKVEGFFVAGLDSTALRRLKTPPQGHGPLGTLREDGRPVNVDDLEKHEYSFGFPPRHPEMKALLGVPVWMHGEVRGTIYVTDKAEVTTFGRWDEDALLVLARHVGTLIERFWE